MASFGSEYASQYRVMVDTHSPMAEDAKKKRTTRSRDRKRMFESDLREPMLDQHSEDVESVPLVSEGRSRGDSTQRLKEKWRYVRKGFTRRGKVVADAFIDSTMNQPHHMSEEYCDDLLVRARLRMLRWVDSLPVRLIGLLILVADIIFIIVETVSRKEDVHLYEVVTVIFQILDLLISAYFCIEVAIRALGLGRMFFRRWFEVCDLVIIATSAMLSILYILLINHHTFQCKDESEIILFGISRLFIILRIFRVIFWARVVHENKSLTRFFRSKVSQNKRRYIDDHFDLDLTYVTDRVIAMSFPSSGSEALYRNSIREVGEFLDKKHFGHYRVYNLCSEREYDTSYFHNQVQRILIDDHNVPKFTDLVNFCEDVLTWMEANPENVVVVHCKGGKGRTGTMISAWLVRAGLFLGAGESLAYFSNRRTDKTRGEKSQGVQTPSQSRYVLYYERLLVEMEGELPPSVSLLLKRITIRGLYGVKGDVNEWMFEALHDGERILECILQNPNREKVEVIKDPGNDSIVVVFSSTESIVLTDDIKFIFHSSNRSIPTANDKCQFYFWFNTTFIDNNRICFDRSELDNLQKLRIQHYYPSHFSVELNFEPYTTSSPL